MVDHRIIFQHIEFIFCVFYGGVALIVIPDCVEAIVFYAKVVAAEHIEVTEQIQGLKLIIVYMLLALVVVNVMLIRFWNGTGENLLQDRVSCLCTRCLQREREREILKVLLILEQMWLHRF